jgi:magnesium transporter
MTPDHAPLVTKDLAEAIREAVAAGDEERLRAALRDVHPADVAEILPGLDTEERRLAFRVLRKRGPDVLSEVDRELQQELLGLLEDDEVVWFARQLPSDEAVDVLGVLPDERRRRVLGLLPETEAKKIRRLLKFPEDTAGGIMATEVVAVRDDALAAEAIELLRDRAEGIDEYQRIYVVDAAGRLVGTLSLGRLLLAKPGMPVSQIMAGEPISVPTDMDQEEVAAVVRKYDLVAVPVVDAEGHLVGNISVDDVVDVIQEEATEDVARLAGTTDAELGEESVLRVSTIRLPWLVIGLGGGLVSAALMSRFEHSLQTMLALAFFVPVITAMGGNVGMQSSAIVVRGLALGQFNLLDVPRRLGREFAIALVNGIVCGTLLSIVAALWRRDPRLGLVVGVSMVSSMIVAAMTGTFFPILLKRFRIDPALAGGPFITISNDILNLLIYFSVAHVSLSWLARR